MNLGTRATWPCGAKPCMCKIFHFAFGSKRVPTQLDMLEIYCVFEFARIRLPKPARQTVITLSLESTKGRESTILMVTRA